MKNSRNRAMRAHGLRVLFSAHPQIRRLKRIHSASAHGNKLWNTNWVLIDFLKGLPWHQGNRVMDVGCGWGLAGIYCAKTFDARVTSVDIDKAVFPFLQLHARINGVRVATLRRGIGGLSADDLTPVHTLIGADICFWESMANALKRMINRALTAGVPRIVIADPGRLPFESLGAYYGKREVGKILDWATRRPRLIRGRILIIENPAAP